MSGFVGDISSLIGAASLLLTPGMILLLVLPAKLLPPRDILPAAFILSPAVLAAELAVAALAGIPFALFVPAAVVTNAVGAAVLAWLRPARIALDVPVEWILPAVFIMAPVAAVLAMDPFRRSYGWHNMMQMAAILEIYALPRPPEEIQLAGFRLSYAWLGWAQVAAIARLTATSPTLVFVPLNLAQLLALVYFVCEAAVVYCGVRQAMIGLASTFALLCAGLFNTLARFVIWSFTAHGELKISPFDSKFLNMDLMCPALSALALMCYALARATRARDLPALWLLCISACTASLLYPLFLPSCLVVLGGFGLFALVAPFVPSWTMPRYRPAELVAYGVAAAASLAIPEAYIWFLGRETTEAVAWLNLPRAPRQVVHLGEVFCFIDAFLVWIAVAAWRARDGAALLVVVIAVALQIPFVIITMQWTVEYKFLFAALLVAAPLVGARLTAWSRHDHWRRTAIVMMFAIATVGNALALMSWRWHDPKEYAGAKLLDEATAEPHPIAGWSDSWQRAIRDETPADAVLLTGPSDQPDAVFVVRALYACASDDKDRYGHSMTCGGELQGAKRYSIAELTRREAVLDRALAADLTAADAAGLMQELASLGRPVVLHAQPHSAFGTWLESKGFAKSIFASEIDKVWLIDRDAFSSASR